MAKLPPVPGRKPAVPLSYPLVDQNMIDFIKEHEGTVPYLYKDTVNKITAGVGFNVDADPAQAYKLGFYWSDPQEKINTRKASSKDLEEAFKRIKPLPPAKEYKFYDPNSLSRAQGVAGYAI